MLRAKTGRISFRVIDPAAGDTTVVNLDDYLMPHQKVAVATKPDITWQFVQFLKQDLTDQGSSEIQIYASSKVSLNGRPLAPLVDPKVDLVQIIYQIPLYQR